MVKTIQVLGVTTTRALCGTCAVGESHDDNETSAVSHSLIADLKSLCVHDDAGSCRIIC